MELIADIFRWLFTMTAIASAVRILPSAYRAITKKAKYLDPIWCLIFNFIVGRLFFTWRAAYYANPLDRPYEGSSLIAAYVWGIGLYVALWIVYGWYSRRG